MAQRTAELVEMVGQEDRGRDFLDPVDHFGIAPEAQRTEDGAAAGERYFQILEDGEILVDRGRLEFAPHPGADDLVFLHPGQFPPLRTRSNRW